MKVRVIPRSRREFARATHCAASWQVFIHYEEPAAEALHQTLKITLPKKWITGPVRNLIVTFLEARARALPARGRARRGVGARARG